MKFESVLFEESHTFTSLNAFWKSIAVLPISQTLPPELQLYYGGAEEEEFQEAQSVQKTYQMWHHHCLPAAGYVIIRTKGMSKGEAAKHATSKNQMPVLQIAH